MHYFGSKQELYRRVIDAAPVPEVSGTPAEATERILASLADRLASANVGAHRDAESLFSRLSRTCNCGSPTSKNRKRRSWGRAIAAPELSGVRDIVFAERKSN
jgi:hypothetical protein